MVTTNYVWEFTNKRKLNKKEFLHYVEKKVFKTIRKYEMLPSDRKIILLDDGFMNTLVLKQILEKKFEVVFGKEPNFSTECLTDIAEANFKKILIGDFDGVNPRLKSCKPLFDLTDQELKKYAELVNINGKSNKQDPNILKLFEKFKKKNPDLDHNIVNAMEQIRNLM